MITNPKLPKPTPVHEIPPMTDPLGRYWEQPSRDSILTDAKHAMMTRETFERLHDYSASEPTGMYAGKMWRSQRRDGWLLRWYRWDTEVPGYIVIESRPIVII